MKRFIRNKMVALAVAAAAAAMVGSACGTTPPEAEKPGGDEGAASVQLAEPAADAVDIVKPASDLPEPVGDRDPRTVYVELEAKELTGKITDGITYNYWTFNGTVPGPMIRVRVGDTVVLTLKNAADSEQVHSIDLHAVNGPGGGAGATQVKPNESKGFTFKAMNPGVYIYHCASPYVPAHIVNGMYGLIVVEPEGGLAPVDKEFYVVQGELYTDLKLGDKGHAQYDGDALYEENPSFVVFNGAAAALTGERAMQAEVGDRVRIFVGNAGVGLVSSFHVIGEIFDVVHQEGASEAVSNIQTTLIPAGGAAWVEFTVDVPGAYTLVDHALNRTFAKGGVAVLHVEGPENPEIYQAGD